MKHLKLLFIFYSVLLNWGMKKRARGEKKVWMWKQKGASQKAMADKIGMAQSLILTVQSNFKK
ncbi:MAG: hypothetical protein K1X81_09160 [Bacteroidia bacterium]|nr:hypothetical protein [Bacteroidia bacterium]